MGVVLLRWESSLEMGDVVDIVNFLYRGKGFITVTGFIDPGLKSGFRGEMRGICRSWTPTLHQIDIDTRMIAKHVKEGMPIGGTFPVNDLRLGIAMVLAHEVQHANQALIHPPSDETFWGSGKKYVTRACERDARRFADENCSILARMLEVELPQRDSLVVEKLEPLITLMDDSEEQFTPDELVYELKLMGMGSETQISQGIKYFKSIGLLRET